MEAEIRGATGQMNKESSMWMPSSEIILKVSETEKYLYEANDPNCLYYAHRWPYRKGRHNKGEFPVVVVKKHFIDLGYNVWVSGQSKMKIDSFILAMFPGARSRRDQSYLNILKVFDEDVVKKFIKIVEAKKKIEGLSRHGGDPDLLVQNPQNLSDSFFVEVKAEDCTGKSKYQDKLNKQQLFVFPLIESYLKCQVKLARVQIVDGSKVKKRS